MNEIKLNELNVKKGSIDFSQELADSIIEQANEVATYIDNTEIDESNIKEVKKMLANAKKVNKALNDKKLEIKKAYMEPYTAFENVIKEAKEIIDNADSTLRNKVKEIEQVEKDEKEEELQRIFNEQVESYGLKEIFTFDMWFKSEFLNKSFSKNKCVENLFLTLDKVKNDLELISHFPHSEKIAYEYLNNTNDVNIAKKVVENRISEEKKLKEYFKNENNR